MWDKSRSTDANCVEYRAALEELPVEIGETEGRAESSSILPAKLSTHAEKCEACRAAADEFWAARRLLTAGFSQGAAGEEARVLQGEGAPWLVKRVMARIAEREVEERRAGVEWSGAVSRLASRVALVAAAMLLVTTTWLYEPSDGGRGDSTQVQTATESGSSYLFDSSTPPANFADALAGGAEKPR